MSPGNLWCEFFWFVKVIEAPALGEAMAGRFVMATILPETMMERGILVEGSTTESSLLGVVFEMSVVAALSGTLFLVKAPTVDMSLSTSVAAGSLVVSSLFEVLGASAAASWPTFFWGGGSSSSFFHCFFLSAAVAFFFRIFCQYPHCC